MQVVNITDAILIIATRPGTNAHLWQKIVDQTGADAFAHGGEQVMDLAGQAAEAMRGGLS